ncbi:MAG: glycosyltransferase family 2 protein [Thermoguttaceae bacterium]
MKLISVVTPCYNEEQNVEETYRQVKAIFASLGKYRYEHIFIDNASTDGTQDILRRLAAADKNVRVIINTRNFGPVRSFYYGLLQGRGDAVIGLSSDLQEPPELIVEFLKRWEAGHKIVVGVKEQSDESPIMFAVRNSYYRLVRRLADIRLIDGFHGFGLYDKSVMDILRRIDDVYPYFRGLIAEIGIRPCQVEYTQLQREHGKSKHSFYDLFDIAMLGIVSHSKVPLRLATMLGFGIACLSLLVALAYFFYKLVFWNSFQLGMAPLVIGIFFFSAVQLFFVGILGEYIGAIHTQVLHRPLVVERERINFDDPGKPPESKLR